MPAARPVWRGRWRSRSRDRTRTIPSCSKPCPSTVESPASKTVSPCRPDRWLENGDTVSLGEVVLGVRHCPGHTPGHVVLFHEETKLAFVGDVLFRGSVGRSGSSAR